MMEPKSLTMLGFWFQMFQNDRGPFCWWWRVFKRFSEASIGVLALRGPTFGGIKGQAKLLGQACLSRSVWISFGGQELKVFDLHTQH